MNNEPSAQEQLESLNQFYSNPETREKLDKIASYVPKDNILAIAKINECNHSNILKWILGNNNSCGYKILEAFLREIASHEANKNNPDLKKLEKYIKKGKEKLEIKTEHEINKNSDGEKGRLDLFFCDQENKTTITIENKPFPGSKENEGQLKKYNEGIKKDHSDTDNFFILLTNDGREPTEDNWLIATYQMLADVIESKLLEENISDNIEKSLKTGLEIYIDLLKIDDIIYNKELKSNCESMLKNDKYSRALDILYNYNETKKEDNPDLNKLCDHIWNEHNIALSAINGYNTGSLEKVYDKIIKDIEEHKSDFYGATVENHRDNPIENPRENRLCPDNYKKLKAKGIEIELRLRFTNRHTYIWFGYVCTTDMRDFIQNRKNKKILEFYSKFFKRPTPDGYIEAVKFRIKQNQEKEYEEFISKIKTTLREFKEAIDELTS